ncbi:MAG: ABC transporter ATP-binding protein, partial [Anaerolineales bacterium]|nr:ABC transporter ATP-binding protein [Anaerolineales bacterium]
MKTQPASFDLRQSLAAKSKLAGIWRMMTDYRLPYLGATLALAVSAASRTLTFLLLRYFADDVLVQRVYIFDTLNRTLAMIALAFVGLACFEGFFSYASGRLAAYTAEGITRRLRDYLFDHIQRLTFSYHSQTPTGDLIERVTSDVDSVRRFFSEQAIGVGRILIVFA